MTAADDEATRRFRATAAAAVEELLERAFAPAGQVA